MPTVNPYDDSKHAWYKVIPGAARQEMMNFIQDKLLDLPINLIIIWDLYKSKISKQWFNDAAQYIDIPYPEYWRYSEDDLEKRQTALLVEAEYLRTGFKVGDILRLKSGVDDTFKMTREILEVTVDEKTGCTYIWRYTEFGDRCPNGWTNRFRSTESDDPNLSMWELANDL